MMSELIIVPLLIVGIILSIMKYYEYVDIKQNELTHGEFVYYSNSPKLVRTLTVKIHGEQINKLLEKRIANNPENKKYKVTYIKRYDESNLSFYYTLKTLVDLSITKEYKQKQINI